MIMAAPPWPPHSAPFIITYRRRPVFAPQFQEGSRYLKEILLQENKVLRWMIAARGGTAPNAASEAMEDIAIRVYHNPTAVVQVSFESRVCPEMDPGLVKIDVCLRFKHINLRMDRVGQVMEYTTHRTIGQSNVCFDFGNESIGLSTAANLSDQFHGWLPELIPSDCDRVSQDIVQYARQVALSRHREGGAIVVRACIEANKETHINMDLNLQDFSSYTVSPSPSGLPRGLNLDEINGLKQFESGNNEDSSSVCSVCLEQFLAGAKIIQLHCYHTFHHSCIASWLEKQASCPLCRLNIIKARIPRSKLLVLDDTLILTALGTRIVIPITRPLA